MESSLACMLVLAFCSRALSYKILIMDPMPARSHYNLGKAVADILHGQGHEVTFINGFPSNKTGFRDIGVTNLAVKKDRPDLDFDMSKQSKISLIMELTDLLPQMMSATLSSKEIKSLLDDKTEKFDLIVVEYFLNEAFLGLGVKYDCPVIVLSPVTMMHWLARDSGNPIAPATVPNVFLSFTKEMTLVERVANTAMGVVQEVVGWAMLSRKQEALYKEHFPEEAARVPYKDLKKKIAMVFMNTHPSLGVARPLLPNAVEIGGYHIGEVEPLPEKYQKILDNAKDGAIFFSMGSNLKSSMMPDNVRDDILKSLGKLKQTVLWKFEKDLPGKPNNVIIGSWMPQTSILAHPNMKLFISHGGLLSTTEAASAGVPLLAVPIFGDQHFNAKSTQERGNGLMLEYSNLTETSLTWALNEMLSNQKYEQTAKKIFRLFHDRPMHPRDTIAFYCEHVIRTGGAKHLAPPDLGLFSSLLLDVFVVLAVPPMVVLLAVIYLCRKCFNKAASEEEKAKKKNKQKKN